MTKVVWNKTAKHLPREGVPVIVCHYGCDIPGNPMYQAVGYYSCGNWYLEFADELEGDPMYTPKYWTERLEMPE